MSVKKEKYQFNIVDFIIIVAIVAAVVFAVNILISDVFNDNKVSVEYTLEINKVRNEDVSKLKIGDVIYSGVDGNAVGTIIKIDIASSEDTVFNKTSNRFVTTVNNGFSDVIITVNTNCVFKNNQYTIGETILSANTFPELNIPFDYSECEITNIYTKTALEDK